MKTIDAYRIVASMSDYQSSRHVSFHSHTLLCKVGCMEYRLWDTFATEKQARSALASYAAEDGVELPEDAGSYSSDIWTWSIEENTIPQSWNDRISNAESLEEVAELFNEAEHYTDFDCAATLKIWCNFYDAEPVFDENRKDVFAETDSAELKYSEVGGWYVEEKDHE